MNKEEIIRTGNEYAQSCTWIGVCRSYLAWAESDEADEKTITSLEKALAAARQQADDCNKAFLEAVHGCE